jgi:hypothetical protein
MALGQIHRAGRIRVTRGKASRFLKFIREAKALEAWESRRVVVPRSLQTKRKIIHTVANRNCPCAPPW